MKQKTTTSKKSDPDRAERPAPDALLKKYLIDTSWRVALPMLTFSLGGNAIDGIASTRPMFSIFGLLAGCAGASLLIRNYMRSLQKDSL